jgi:hypothetical protein
LWAGHEVDPGRFWASRTPWRGERTWLVALVGEVDGGDDVASARERQIIAEVPERILRPPPKVRAQGSGLKWTARRSPKPAAPKTPDRASVAVRVAMAVARIRSFEPR